MHLKIFALSVLRQESARLSHPGLLEALFFPESRLSPIFSPIVSFYSKNGSTSNINAIDGHVSDQGCRDRAAYAICEKRVAPCFIKIMWSSTHNHPRRASLTFL
jgi:hypothetical protein